MYSGKETRAESSIIETKLAHGQLPIFTIKAPQVTYVSFDSNGNNISHEIYSIPNNNDRVAIRTYFLLADSHQELLNKREAVVQYLQSLSHFSIQDIHRIVRQEIDCLPTEEDPEKYDWYCEEGYYFEG